MSAATLNWSAVQDAARRSKLGCARQGDAELCAAAFKSDRERYRRESARGHREAVRAVNPLAGDDS